MLADVNTMPIKDIEKELKENYRALAIEEAKQLQGTATSAEVDEASKLARRTVELQARMKSFEEVAGVSEQGRELQSKTMPKRQPMASRGIRTTPGHLFVKSEAFAAYKAMGMNGWSAFVDTKGFKPSVDLYGDDAVKFRARLQTKDFPGAGITLPDVDADSVTPYQRDPDWARVQEPEMLTIRDVMTVLPVESDTVRFVKYEYTRAAAAQNGKGALKPYSAMEATTQTKPVETIAVLHKVAEQDIEDAPRLIGIINGEMRLDVRVEEERQLLWGTTGDGEIDGLYAQGVEAREFDRDTTGSLIDIVRRMRTDLRKLFVTPNAVLIDPIDWENIELTKGSSNDHYIWGLVSTLRGPQIWSMRVVESDAMTHPDTGARRILMGDFIRGATLYDRHDVRLAVGFVDDDFARNLRTLRAEERLALGVKRDWAFIWYGSGTSGS